MGKGESPPIASRIRVLLCAFFCVRLGVRTCVSERLCLLLLFDELVLVSLWLSASGPVSMFDFVIARVCLCVSPSHPFVITLLHPPFLIGRWAKRHHTVSPRRTHNKMIALNDLLARPCGLTRYAAQTSLSELSRVTRTAIWQARAKIRRRDTKALLARSRGDHRKLTSDSELCQQ